MADGVPSWVERDFRAYLRCGILAHGFARARCSGCGYDFLVAFSCKGRGVCPSCNARRILEASTSSIVSPIPHRMAPPLLSLTPLEFLERLALLIHPPRIHRHRYHGVLAPNAKLRYQVIALGRELGGVEESTSEQLDAQSVTGSSDGAAPGRRTSSRWAALIARIYEVLPLVCPSCGGSMSIIAFITDPIPLRAILSYLDLPSRPPLLSPARAPPQTDFGFDQSSGFDPTDPEPIPELEFDQSVPD